MVPRPDSSWPKRFSTGARTRSTSTRSGGGDSRQASGLGSTTSCDEEQQTADADSGVLTASTNGVCRGRNGGLYNRGAAVAPYEGAVCRRSLHPPLAPAVSSSLVTALPPDLEAHRRR